MEREEVRDEEEVLRGMLGVGRCGGGRGEMRWW